MYKVIYKAYCFQNKMFIIVIVLKLIMFIVWDEHILFNDFYVLEMFFFFPCYL